MCVCVFVCFIHTTHAPRRTDDLSDLKLLLDHVKDSEVLVLLQTKGVLSRPWVILELYTALTNQVPVVALNVMNASAYDYGDAEQLLTFLDEMLDQVNPGAADLLRRQGVDLVDVAFRLADALPAIISTGFYPNGSARQIEAALGDLADQICHAKPIAPPTTTKEKWLQERQRQKKATKAKRRLHGQSQGQGADSGTEQKLAVVPDTVPELPGALLVRSDLTEQIKSELLNETGSMTAALTSDKAKHKSSVHGMGGVGTKHHTPACTRLRPSTPIFTHFRPD